MKLVNFQEGAGIVMQANKKYFVYYTRNAENDK